ncbi:MAG: hypothetical protein LBP86_02095 [Azoarcus sp.]|jgi:hypothetical protein|nr:hypothetical protein [Azoarcus sp.]
MALAALALVFLLWYPAPLHEAVGVTHIFLLLLGVDVIIGPCLTAVVARPGKERKKLLFDISIIVTVQLAAFLYGMHTVAEGRPLWLVLNVDRFTLVRAPDMDTRRLDDALPEYRQPRWDGPQWVFAPLPTDLEASNALTFESVFDGVDIYQRPEFYRPLAEGRSLMQAKALPLDKLEPLNAEDDVRRILDAHPDADAWLPLMSKQPMVVLLRKEEGKVVAIVDLRPW